jgi:hypothetical protein
MSDEIKRALADMAAGGDMPPEKASGVRAALRVVCAHLDARALALAPLGKRTNAVDRHVAEVLRGVADTFDAWRRASYPAAAVEAAARSEEGKADG